MSAETQRNVSHPRRTVDLVSLVRLAAPRLCVGDTCALMNEVLRFAHTGELTSLLVALHHDTARMFISRHVFDEVAEHLSRRAVESGIEPTKALVIWQHLFLPVIRVVDVPATWGRKDRRVRGVLTSDADDAPSARLAIALAPCYVITDDSDLIDNGFGTRSWLTSAHGFANYAQVEMGTDAAWGSTVLTTGLGAALVRGFLRLPAGGQIAAVLVGAAILFWWRSSGRMVRNLGALKGTIATFVEGLTPLIQLVATRHCEAKVVWAQHSLPPAVEPTLEELVARILAMQPHPGGLLAGDVARALDIPGNLKKRTHAVRQILPRSSAFVEVSRGRWQLGVVEAESPKGLSPGLVADWLRRSCRQILPAENASE